VQQISFLHTENKNLDWQFVCLLNTIYLYSIQNCINANGVMVSMFTSSVVDLDLSQVWSNQRI